MAVAPEFLMTTKRAIASRAANICSSPTCYALTVGPSRTRNELDLRVGEAAHIRAAKPEEARYDASMTDAQRADPANGIWLCDTCHRMIDANQGADFPVEMLHSWKDEHEKQINYLLTTHQSPLPILRRNTDAGRLAQQVVDLIASRGVFFAAPECEVPAYVEESLQEMRGELRVLINDTERDSALKRIVAEIGKACGQYMNETGPYPGNRPVALRALRQRVGILLKRLRDEYGCDIPPWLSEIIPQRGKGIPIF